MNWTIFWTVLGIVGLIGEAITLFNAQGRDTLSWNVGAVLRWRGTRVALFALWCWLTWHWFIEAEWVWEGKGHVWDDWLIVFVGAGIAFIPTRKES